ncbi:MAG: hypothetical protein NW226_03940 [Microscillaceae bacterium]|nr:hypothetical protein [Microscillaceae bacterium]
MISKTSIKYLTDEKGEKIAVQIPIQVWENFLADYTHLLQYQYLKNGLQEAFQEWEDIKAGKKTAISLNDFLNAD